ncbi:MAG: class I tRNA ligase family protein, partial [Candidatus Cloacimonetes bacterium]|nr:class I tRNA ligase family protein [Candidatus Cloacimonadota bacterium]
KMSKSKGNTIDPNKLMIQYGADTIRWYLLVVSPPWIPTKFDEKVVKEILNKFIGTLRNVYSFYVTYANIDNFDASKYKIQDEKSAEIDRWIISRLNTLIKQITIDNENYNLTRSVRAIQSFIIDDLSNWYVRRSRRRYWELTLTEDKKDAFLTLYQVLITVSKLMAPFAPYLSEEIYTNLTGKESVHLEHYPIYNANVINPTLEEEMKTVIELVSLGRAARNTCQIKVRQTLQTLYVPEKYKNLIQRIERLIKEEINVREIHYISERDNFVEYEIKVNYKVMGPKYSRHMKNIIAALSSLDGNHIVETLHQGKDYYLEIDGGTFKISEEDINISIKDKEGFVFEANNSLFVALDIKLTPELIEEGMARELVNKIQFTRKVNKFEIMDRIKVFFVGNDEIKKVFEKQADYILKETLTDSFHEIEIPKKDMTKWDINGKEVYLSIEKN